MKPQIQDKKETGKSDFNKKEQTIKQTGAGGEDFSQERGNQKPSKSAGAHADVNSEAELDSGNRKEKFSASDKHPGASSKPGEWKAGQGDASEKNKGMSHETHEAREADAEGDKQNLRTGGKARDYKESPNLAKGQH